MSKLSLSRSRAKANGPMTSTQDPRAREVPTGRLSRDELIFQRQIEAAMLQSKWVYRYVIPKLGRDLGP